MTQELLLCRWMGWSYRDLQDCPADAADAAFALAVEATNREADD